MKTLEPTRKDHDCDLTLIERRGPFAVYHRTKQRRCRGYEVIHIRQHEAGEVFGKTIEAHEGYPTANQWGRDGISLPTLELAMDRLDISVQMGVLATAGRMERATRPKKPLKKRQEGPDSSSGHVPQ